MPAIVALMISILSDVVLGMVMFSVGMSIVSIDKLEAQQFSIDYVS